MASHDLCPCLDAVFAGIPAALPATAYVRVADVPGCGEPGSGTIPWTEVMAWRS